MKCKDLSVVNLNITEDHYEYKAPFRICDKGVCIDVDLERIEDSRILEEIKKSFSIDEPIPEMKKILMEKIIEASKLESKIFEGENCCKPDTDVAADRDIDALSMS